MRLYREINAEEEAAPKAVGNAAHYADVAKKNKQTVKQSNHHDKREKSERERAGKRERENPLLCGRRRESTVLRERCTPRDKSKVGRGGGIEKTRENDNINKKQRRSRLDAQGSLNGRRTNKKLKARR